MKRRGGDGEGDLERSWSSGGVGGTAGGSGGEGGSITAAGAGGGRSGGRTGAAGAGAGELSPPTPRHPHLEMVIEVDLQVGGATGPFCGAGGGYCSGQGIQGLCLNASSCQSTSLETTSHPSHGPTTPGPYSDHDRQ